MSKNYLDEEIKEDLPIKKAYISIDKKCILLEYESLAEVYFLDTNNKKYIVSKNKPLHIRQVDVTNILGKKCIKFDDEVYAIGTDFSISEDFDVRDPSCHGIKTPFVKFSNPLNSRRR